MLSFITILALVASATAATSPLVARDDSQSCAIRTLLSSTACSTGDSACLCSDTTRNAVLQDIETACGSEQSDLVGSIADDACKSQLARRATQPSATVVHMALATPSSSAAGHANGPQESSSQEGCTCANTMPKSPSASTENSPVVSQAKNDSQDPEMSGTSSHNSNTPSGNSPQNGRVHAPSSMAAQPASSSARHGVMTTASASSSARVATPSGADAFTPFKGAGSQNLPSLTAAAAGSVLAAVVGAFVVL